MNNSRNEAEVILGVDTHLDTHVGVLLNAQGHLLGCLMVNSPMERLFRSLKSEWLPVTGYMNQREAKRDISYYLMDYYNWQRPHQHNDGIPPAKAEMRPNQVSGFS